MSNADNQSPVMNSNTDEQKRAVEYLIGLLHEAAEAGADTVELERVPGGLEISILARGSGLGTVLKDRALESELMELIVQRAGLEKRVKGKMNWSVFGENCRITVEEYDSFGEPCFRLKLS
jgi:hypothetical protein